MSTPRIQALQKAISKELLPVLHERGFAYEHSTRTFRRVVGECTQIVNFQAGVRSQTGRFTVNLAVFHPIYNDVPVGMPLASRPMEYEALSECRGRLSNLRTTPFTAFFKRWIRDRSTALRWWLTTPTDKWYRLVGEEHSMVQELGRIRDDLLEKGLPWLDSHSDLKAMKAWHLQKPQFRTTSPNQAL